MSQFSFRTRLRSSCALIWLRVSFFFFFCGGVAVPPAWSSAPLPAGVPWTDAAGVCRRERAGVLVPLPRADFASANASSTTAVLPFCVTRPASTCQISEPVWDIDDQLGRAEDTSAVELTQCGHELLVV